MQNGGDHTTPIGISETPGGLRAAGSSRANAQKKMDDVWNLENDTLLISPTVGGTAMDGIIYLVGLIVIIMAILSFFGLR